MYDTQLKYTLSRPPYKSVYSDGWVSYDFTHNVCHPSIASGNVPFARMDSKLTIKGYPYQNGSKYCNVSMKFNLITDQHGKPLKYHLLDWSHMDSHVQIPESYHEDNYAELFEILANTIIDDRKKLSENLVHSNNLDMHEEAITA